MSGESPAAALARLRQELEHISPWDNTRLSLAERIATIERKLKENAKQIVDLIHERKQAEAQVATPLALLKELEWSADDTVWGHDVRLCPLCGGMMPSDYDYLTDERKEQLQRGHYTDCRIARALEGA